MTVTALRTPSRTATRLADQRVSAWRRLKNRGAAVLVALCVLVAVFPLVWLLWSVASNGVRALTRMDWFTHSQRNLTFTDPGGGAYHAILGTIQQVGLCSAISVPIAVLVAVYLVEYPTGWLARAVSFAIDILTGIPSIVAALFVYALIVGFFDGQRAGWLVSLALVMLMIPVVVRASEQTLRLVPDELREAAFALGVPKWRAITGVVIPTALSGIVTGIMLGIARVAGETAPLLVLVGYSPSINADLFAGPQASLPGMINREAVNFNTQGTYLLGANGQPELVHNYAVDRVWGAALTLILLILALNLVARMISRRRPGTH